MGDGRLLRDYRQHVAWRCGPFSHSMNGAARGSAPNSLVLSALVYISLVWSWWDQNSPNQVLTHAARAALVAARLWWPRAARAKGSGQSKDQNIVYIMLPDVVWSAHAAPQWKWAATWSGKYYDDWRPFWGVLPKALGKTPRAPEGRAARGRPGNVWQVKPA